jgi:predicted MFS family arabinose efflux permease
MTDLGQQAAKGFRKQALLFGFVRILTNTTVRMMSPFLPEFSRQLGISIEQITVVLAMRSGSGILIPFLTGLLESKTRRFGILLGMSVFVLGAALVLIWPTWQGFAFALLITSLGKTIMDPSIQAYVGDQIPYTQRGSVTGLIELGWGLSFMLGVPLVGFMIVRFGWISPFPVFVVVGAFILLGLWRVVPTTPVAAAGGTHIFKNFAQVLRHRPALASLIAGLCIASASELIQIVLGLWLEADFNAPVAGIGAAALVIGTAELFGEGFVSTLTDRLGKKRSIVFGLLVTSAAALLFLTPVDSLNLAMVVLFIYFLAFEFTVVTTIPIMTEVMPKFRATTIGLAMAFTYLGRTLGTLAGPLLFGLNGIASNVFFAVLLNLAAVAAYSFVKFPGEGAPEIGSTR